MSGLVSLVLLVPRYMLITGLTVLALAFFSDELNAMGDAVDFESILPFTMREFIPHGLLGVLIAALLAAFMSTYAATVNAAPAYIVNDVYKRYFNPAASDRVYVWMSYATSLAVVVVGTVIGLYVESLNDLVQWIVAALYGGYTAANVLKWHWWRFNSYGFFWGMLSGMLAAGFVPALLPGVTPIYGFPIILGISLVGSIVGSLATPADDVEVLKNFYVTVRPWGFWRPIHELVAAERPGTLPNRDFVRNVFNVVVGVTWQTALTAAGIYLVLQDYNRLGMTVAVIAVTSATLKFTWYDKLRDEPEDAAPGRPS
jgi:Na+/proline symporter